MRIETGRKVSKDVPHGRNKRRKDELCIKLSNRAPLEIGGTLRGMCEGVKVKWFWRQGQGMFVHRNVNPLLMITWVDDDARTDVMDYTYLLTPQQMDQAHEIMVDCMEAERDVLKSVRALARSFVEQKMRHVIKDPDDPDGFFNSDLYKSLIKECISKSRVKMGMDGPAWDKVFILDNECPLCTYADEIETAVMHALKRSFNVKYEVKRCDEV